MLKGYKMEAQQVPDELFSDHLLPLKLSAHEIKSVGAAEYIVYFHDSRLHSVAPCSPFFVIPSWASGISPPHAIHASQDALIP